MPVFIEKMEDGAYHCPRCSFSSTSANTMRLHCPERHDFTATTRKTLSSEERLLRQRERMRRLRAARRAQTAGDKSHRRRATAILRATYTVVDADERGVYGSASPFVEYRQSLIPNAGNGLFAATDLRAGDVVTQYDGMLTHTEPKDPTYAIGLPTSVGTMYIDGLRKPKKGRGLASFVNKESRTPGLLRKNCEFVQVGMRLYIEMTKDLGKGDELYTTYSKGYRLHR